MLTNLSECNFTPKEELESRINQLKKVWRNKVYLSL